MRSVNRALAYFVALLWALPASGADDTHIYSVCDVMTNLQSLAGKHISVLGMVKEKGKVIRAYCRSCSVALRSADHIWPHSLYIHLSVRGIAKQLSTLVEDDKPHVIALEEILRVNFKKPLSPLGKEEIDVGYGHLGVHPARIDVIRVRECGIDVPDMCLEGKRFDSSRCKELPSKMGSRGMTLTGTRQHND